MESVLVRAPSNIALIKYMGKKSVPGNFAENPSLSMTLDRLCTFAEVRIVARGGGTTQIVSEMPSGLPDWAFDVAFVPNITQAGRDRMIAHMDRIRGCFPDSSSWSIELRTANTFPDSAGIASSASSFAAVTLGVSSILSGNVDRFRSRWVSDAEWRGDFASISRQGSGSSCRSLDGPWVIWEDSGVRVPRSTLPPLTDLVLLVDAGQKEVSSSEAHDRSKTSPLWVGRPDHARERLDRMEKALAFGDLRAVALLSWMESWEMHSLFHTSKETFTYFKPLTIEALRWAESFLQDPVPPIVTMDAGPNLHFLVPTSSAPLWRNQLEQRFPGLRILEDRQGAGAEFL